MNLKETVLSKIFAIITIISLLVSDFVFVGTSLVSYALDAVTTISSNVELTAYFVNSSGEKVYKIEECVDKPDAKLYVDIAVKKEGYFNGQISINSSNLTLNQDANNEYIKSISENVVTLNQINAGKAVTLELGIKPVNTSAILNTKTDVVISGSYVDSKNAEKNKHVEVNGTSPVEVEWKLSNNTQAELDAILLTNASYKVNGETKKVVQILMNSKITENNYPVKNTDITVSVPEKVKNVEVHARSTKATNENEAFSKANYTYNEQDKMINIKLSNENQSNISWNKNAQDTFVVTYEFEENENVASSDINVSSNIKTYDAKELKADKKVHIENEIDGIVSGSIESVEKNIYKGKIYTGEGKDYTVNNKVNIDYIDEQGITINGNESIYVIDQKEETANIVYKQTKVNKQQFLDIFGQDGYLTIKNNEKVIANINNSLKADESGNIIVKYPEQVKNIVIDTSKPINVGTLNIENTKTVLSTGYTREKIGKITEIKESTSVKNEIKSTSIVLKDTETLASLKIKNLSKISTIADSQNLELEAILQANDESKDLYKNPKIIITLPQEITITSFNVDALYLNGLELDKKNTNIIENNKLQIILNGEQKSYDGTEGTVLNISLNIKTNILTPSKASSIQMTYTNEYENVEKTEKADFEFESVDGLMIYNQIRKYNSQNDSIVTVSSETAYGTIDINSSEREIAIGTALINNYKEKIENVVLIGTIPSTNSEESFKAKLNNVEINNVNAKVFYSSKVNAEANDESWGDNKENAVAYKIEIPQMEKEEIVKLKVTVTIPEKIGYNKNGSFTTKTSCTFQGMEQTNNSNIVLSTKASLGEESKETTEIATTENKLIKTITTTGNDLLAENDNIFEGQTIKYKVIVTNNTENDYSNVTIKSKQKNGYVWDYVEKEAYNPHYKTTSKKDYYEVTDSNDITIGKIESFKSGESYTFEYEAVAYLLSNEKIDGAQTYGTISVVSEDEKLNETETTIKNNIKKGELQVKLYHGYDKDMKLTSGGDIKALLSVMNITDQPLKDVEVKVAFSNKLKGNISLNEENEEIASFGEQQEDKDGIQIITLKIASIEANKTVNIDLYTYTQESMKDKEESIWILSQAETPNKNTYVSNKFTREVYNNENNIKVSQQILSENGTKIDTENAKLNDGDKIQLIATIENNEDSDINVNIEYNLDTMLDIKNAKIIKAIEEAEEDVTKQVSYNNLRQNNQKMKAGEKITISMLGTVDAFEVESLTNKLNVYDNSNGKTVKDNLSVAVNTQHEEIIEPEDEDSENPEENQETDANNNTNTNEDNNQNDSDDKENKKLNKYTVSGVIWIDKDKDGRKNSSEERFSGITIEAVNLDKGKILASTKTLSNGEYTLTLEEGNYVLIFNYDTELYTTTQYRQNGVNEAENSDVIERNIKLNGTSKKAGITDKIDLNSNITNIDLGLVLRSKFDLKLQKYVSKITVTNDEGTKIYEQPDNKTLAKAEIKSKNLSGSLVVIEYKIKVKNDGDIAGYAKNIVDYMPSSLNFNSKMNSDWYLSGEKLYNTSLANTKIEPGETKELTLVLTKTMTESNTGLINNKAAIKESSNLLGIQDETEDVGSADVIISVTTGALVSYVTITITTFIIIAGVAYIISRKYLSRRI